MSGSARPATSSSTTTSNGSNGIRPENLGSKTIISGHEQPTMFITLPQRLDIQMEKRKVVQAMALPNSGLDIRDRAWLKIPIPMSFLGNFLKIKSILIKFNQLKNLID